MEEQRFPGNVFSLKNVFGPPILPQLLDFSWCNLGIQRHFGGVEIAKSVGEFSYLTKPVMSISKNIADFRTYSNPQVFQPFPEWYDHVSAYGELYSKSLIESTMNAFPQSLRLANNPLFDWQQRLLNNELTTWLTAIRPRSADVEQTEVFEGPGELGDDPKIVPVTLQLLRKGGELIRHVAESPGRIFQLSPRHFEEFVGELFFADGFQVELTPQTRDGGCDLIVRKTDVLDITREYVVECKRYGERNKVGIDVVQRLVGVAVDRRAHAGLVVTTSTFTADARKCAARSSLQIQLRDYMSLITWVKRHGLTERNRASQGRT